MFVLTSLAVMTLFCTSSFLNSLYPRPIYPFFFFFFFFLLLHFINPLWEYLTSPQLPFLSIFFHLPCFRPHLFLSNPLCTSLYGWGNEERGEGGKSSSVFLLLLSSCNQLFSVSAFLCVKIVLGNGLLV